MGSFAEVLRSFDDLVICMDEAHRYYAPASKVAINYLNPVLGLEFTATPKNTNKNIIYHYGLEEGAGKFLKIPVVMGRTNTAGYSDDDIEEMKLKDGKKERRGNSKHHMRSLGKRTAEDDERFAESFEMLILKVKEDSK